MASSKLPMEGPLVIARFVPGIQNASRRRLPSLPLPCKIARAGKRMPDDAKPEEPFWDPVALRRGILITTGIETAFFFLVIASTAIPPSAPGTSMRTIAAFIAMFIFFTIVLPAMVLAFFNLQLIVALGLAAIAGMLYVTLGLAFPG